MRDDGDGDGLDWAGVVRLAVFAAAGMLAGAWVALGVGAHWLIGVVAGAALGVAVDFLTARMGPRD